jgi:hypothetical protein
MANAAFVKYFHSLHVMHQKKESKNYLCIYVSNKSYN